MRLKAIWGMKHASPPPAMSIIDGKKVILDAQKDFISALWKVIKGKLSRSDVDSASSLRDEIQDQARLTLHDMDVESSIKEVFVEAGECFTNAMFEEQDKVEEVSSLRQPLDNMKKEIKVLCKRAKDLQVFLTGAEDEVQGAKLATLFATHEFDACFDTDLTNDLGQKKEHLESLIDMLDDFF
ncbi:hypothetical protein KY289_030626 [Solanum tuberosum]|nr:hypothetical protein KY289_030626 [Solanum tuberosum]